MASLYFSTINSDGKQLSIGPMTNKRAASLDRPLRSLAGYFLVESDSSSSKVLARVDDDDAVLELARLLGLR